MKVGFRKILIFIGSCLIYLALVLMLFNMTGCKSRKISKSKIKKETTLIKDESEDFEVETNQSTTTKTDREILRIQDGGLLLEIEPIGEAHVKPDGSFTGEAKKITVITNNKDIQKINESIITEDSLKSSEISRSVTKTDSTSFDRSSDVNRKSDPSIKPYLGISIGISLILIIIALIYRFRKKIF